jgi:hypothetical protein
MDSSKRPNRDGPVSYPKRNPPIDDSMARMMVVGPAVVPLICMLRKDFVLSSAERVCVGSRDLLAKDRVDWRYEYR